MPSNSFVESYFRPGLNEESHGMSSNYGGWNKDGVILQNVSAQHEAMLKVVFFLLVNLHT